MDKIKVAIIGTGALGSKHVKNYQLIENAEVIALCDTDIYKAQNFANELGIPFYANYKKIPLSTIQAVSICVPTKMHFKVAKYFLENKIHCLIEKPITTSVKQADVLIEIAQKNNLILQVGHIERFNAAFQAIKDIIVEPKFIETHRLSPFPGRSLDVGAVLDIMIHDIDIILGLVKSEIKHIDAVGVNVLTELEDIANARLTFKNGCIANLTASRVSDEYMRKIRIFLANTYISLDYFKQEAFIYKKDSGKITKDELPIEKEESLKKELMSYLDCVKNNLPPLVSGVEARNALSIALKIIKKIHG
jgi:predicted dehydrogenase